MATIEQVDDSEVQPPAYKPQGKLAKQSHDVIAGLVPGKTTIIRPDEGESIRGMKTSLTRIANKSGTKIRLWDDGEKLFVQPM